MEQSVEGHNLNTALISALVGLVASLMTFFGVRRQSRASEAEAYLRAGSDMHRLTMEAAEKIREELQQELARAENARRSSETLVAKLTAQVGHLEGQLAMYRRGYRKVTARLIEIEGPSGLAEMSDLPDF